MKDIEDKRFADDIKNKVLTEQQKEELKREEAKRLQREYMN